MIPPVILSFLGNKYVIGTLVVLTLVGSTGGYIWYLRSTNDTLREEKKELTIAVEQQHRTIERLKEDVEDVIKAKDEIAEEKEKIAKKHSDLEKTLNRENRKKKSLEELAIKKTSLIQKKVNRATKEVFDCFEIITRGGDC